MFIGMVTQNLLIYCVDEGAYVLARAQLHNEHGGQVLAREQRFVRGGCAPETTLHHIILELISRAANESNVL
jgi:hypothetical protein